MLAGMCFLFLAIRPLLEPHELLRSVSSIIDSQYQPHLFSAATRAPSSSVFFQRFLFEFVGLLGNGSSIQVEFPDDLSANLRRGHPFHQQHRAMAWEELVV